MRASTERRLLQVAVLLGGAVAVTAGLSGAFLGTGFLGGGGTIDVDSHIRYLSGLLLAIGIAFWLAIPAIEQHTARVRLLTAVVFVGGLARLYGMITTGAPHTPMLLGLVMELAVTPLLCAWQSRVATRTALEQTGPRT